jgi:hypothetical protein
MSANLPQDLPRILQRRGIATHFIRRGASQAIEALSIKAPYQRDWMMSDSLGPDLAWHQVCVEKGWKSITPTGPVWAFLVTDPQWLPPVNKIETVLDLLAEQISALPTTLLQLIIKTIHTYLIYAEKTFKATLPRLQQTPIGVMRLHSSLQVQCAPSADCISQTARHLMSLLDAIQARDPGRITLPIAMNDMTEVHQALRDLMIQESKTPTQVFEEREATAQAELDSARKFLADCRRDRGDVRDLINDCIKGKRISDPKEKRQLMVDAEARVTEAEHQVELAARKFPLLLHNQDGDAQLQHFRQHRG